MSAAPRAFASFLAALLVLVPLPWHWRSRNIPTIAIIAWLFVLNIAHGVDVIVWWNDVDIRLVVWCDIVTKLVIGANIALPAACFSLCMRLESVASIRQVKSTYSEKKRRTIIDLILCVAVPIIYMAVHYVVQGHRFDIVQTIGCQPETYVSIPEFFLIWFTPIIFCLGTFVFATLALLHFLRRRATFARHLAHARGGLTPARYFRLMAMAIVMMLWDVAVFAATLAFNYRGGLRPWTSWADVHSNFSNINRFPLVFIPAATMQWATFLWWTMPVSAYIFFGFFAFGRDAVIEYAACLQWVRRAVRRRMPGSQPTALLSSKDASAPRHVVDSGLPVFKVDHSFSSTVSTYAESADAQSPTASETTYCKHLDEPEKAREGAVVEDEPLPPYPHRSILSQSPSLIVVTPPPALVAGGIHVFPTSGFSHTDNVV